MLSRKKQSILLFIWVLVNLIAVITASLVVFSLYGGLRINRYLYAENWLRAVGSLAFCGGVQGLIVGGLQTIVFALAKLRVNKWFVTNIVSMTLGMTLPITFAIITRSIFGIAENLDSYAMAGFVFSWIIAGVLSGIFVGRNKNQKIALGLVNTIAYIFWGIATIGGIIALAAAFDNHSESASILASSFLLIVPILTIGAWLNSYIFRELIKGDRLSY